MRLLWLPAMLRRAGLTVVETQGWRTRGRDTLDPKVVVVHHTASQPPAPAPSLGICMNGRPGVPGPLCQVLIGRDGVCYVVASGVANNAGIGQWQGISGNSRTIGIEAENNGVGEPWGRIYPTVVAAAAVIARHAGIPVPMICGHKEWTRRKIDPNFDMASFRARVAATQPTQPPPSPPPGGLVSVLLQRYPPAKAGPITTGPLAGSFRWYNHTTNTVLGWRGAALYGDQAQGGTDQDSIDGTVPRVVQVPVAPGHHLVGLCWATLPDGSEDPRYLVACASDGGTFSYECT